MHCEINSNRVASVPDRRFGGQGPPTKSNVLVRPLHLTMLKAVYEVNC